MWADRSRGASPPVWRRISAGATPINVGGEVGRCRGDELYFAPEVDRKRADVKVVLL